MVSMPKNQSYSKRILPKDEFEAVRDNSYKLKIGTTELRTIKWPEN